MKKVVLMLFIVFAVSCKNDKPQTEEVVTPEKAVKEDVEVVKPNEFIVEIELKYSDSESIKLFATDVFINNNRTMNINITEKVEGSNNFKKVILDFPENIKPDYQVGISFGTQKEKSITFNEIKISYGEVEFIVNSNELNDYFTFNKFIDYNSETGIIQTKKVKGKHNPLMFFRRKVVDSL